MNLLNLFKVKSRYLAFFCFFVLYPTGLYSQYFKLDESSFSGCWQLTNTEIKEYYFFIKDGTVFEKNEWGNELKDWKISRDSLITEQRTYKNIGGYVLQLNNKFFAILSVSKKKIILMDLEMATVILHLKKAKCKLCKEKP